MTRYRLCSHVEEFHCPECGEPVYLGEHAVEHEGDCFCSGHCAEVAAAAVVPPEAAYHGRRYRLTPVSPEIEQPLPPQEPYPTYAELEPPIRRPARERGVVGRPHAPRNDCACEECRAAAVRWLRVCRGGRADQPELF